MAIKDVVLQNNKLGINTVFYNEKNGALGYCENNTIFLNEFYDEETLRIVNRHEVLHFYENSKSFKNIKKRILSSLGNNIENLKEEYLLKYSGLYSEEEIRNGILENEIIIDIIIGNGRSFEYKKELYDFIVGNEAIESVSNKRYLNLNISNQYKEQYRELTKWEKLFVVNYYRNKDYLLPTNKETKYQEIRDTIIRELDNLYAVAENSVNFLISTDSEELIRRYEREISTLLSSGKKDQAEYFKSHKKMILKRMAEKYQKVLQAEYSNIVNTIKSTSYEPAFKYLMLNETLSKTYRQQKTQSDINNLVGKRIAGETIKSHMNLSEEVLAVIYNNLEEYSNFANLYFAGLSMLNKSVYEKSNVSIDNVDTFGKGKWIRFEGKKNNPDSYIRRAQELSSMVQDTPWCTKEQASMHLEEGDFYLFVDNNNKARIGVKLIGDRIDEVRGIKNANAQELEEEYRDVAIEFLTKNENIKFGKEWLEKEKWNMRLIEYSRKIDEGTLSKEDIKNLVYDLTEISDYKAHYAQCGNRLELLEKIVDMKVIRKALAKKYGCKPKQVCLGNVEKSDINQVKFPYVVVLGNAHFSEYGYKMDLSNLRFVLGDLHCIDNSVYNLNNLEVVSGSLHFTHISEEHLDNLRVIGEIGDLYETNIKSMKNLKEIGGTFALICSEVGDLSGLETIGEDLHFEYGRAEDLSGLKNVNGNVYLAYSSIGKIGDFNCEGRIRGYSLERDEITINNPTRSR